MILAHSLAAALLALQPVDNPEAIPPHPDGAAPAITDLAQLPLEQAAAPRCGVVFAVVEGAQASGKAEALRWPDLASSNGREFFVRAMARLMEEGDLDRATIIALVERETQRLTSDRLKPAYELMEPCLLMKQAAGL